MELIYSNNCFTKRFNKRDSICGVYRATFTNSTNGKCYIGYSKDIWHRIGKHRDDYNKKCEQHLKFYRAVNKYGWDNIRFELCEECTPELLRHTEMYWGAIYYSHAKGYNTVPCGTFNPMDDPTIRGNLIAKHKIRTDTARDNKEWCATQWSMSDRLQKKASTSAALLRRVAYKRKLRELMNLIIKIRLARGR